MNKNQIKYKITMKKLNQNWKDYYFFVKGDNLLSPQLIKVAIENFYNQNMSHLTDDSHAIVLFRVRTGEGSYKIIGTLQVLGKNDLDYYIKYIGSRLSVLQDGYTDISINKIVFSYGIRKGQAPINLLSSADLDNKIAFHKYGHYKLPQSMDISTYGTVILSDIQSDGANKYIVQNRNGNLYIITSTNDSNKVEVIIKGMPMLKYVDTLKENGSFMRIIENKKYMFNSNNGIDFFSVEKPTKFIKTINPGIHLDNNIITMDIETKVIDKPDGSGDLVHDPYLISYFDGVKARSFYITDYKSSDKMILACFNSIFTNPKYKGHTIYFHNFSQFDSIFVLGALIKDYSIKPVIHNSKIIQVKISDGKLTLPIYDSLLVLPASLNKLSKAFNIVNQKGSFPFDFVNSLTDYNYIGPYGDNANWNLKEEAIKYCELDCIALYQVLVKFNQLIYNQFCINITKYPTISSLTFAIYRGNYMPKNTIPQITGVPEAFIRMGYTGGSTDVFIPSFLSSGPSDKLYVYDVNSLYPYLMANNELPSGKLVYFEGDIMKYKPDALGLYKCRVITPSNLDHPIIQIHKNNRTISPLGTFDAVLYSEEIKNAIKYGYQFEIINGYYFKDKSNLFMDYMNLLYDFRSKYSKDNPINFIAKLLMNSLYGRFGLNDKFLKTEVISSFDLNKKLNKSMEVVKAISEIREIGNNHFIVSSVNPNIDNNMLSSLGETHNVSIGVASAITALGRIFMSKFKNNPNIKLYYGDNDIIFVNLSPSEMNKLFSNIIGNKLGQLKLEYVVDKAVFLGPKSYFLETINGDKIIKIKGLKGDSINKAELTFEEFDLLLYKDKAKLLKQIKWFKNLSQSNISVLTQTFELKSTSEKREAIFNLEGKAIGTKPFTIYD